MLLTAIWLAGTSDGHLAGGHVGGEVEDRLVVRLVPRRHELARIGVLELRVQRALLAGLGVVIDREQAVRLRADLARVVHRERVLADGQRLVECERGGLRLRIGADLRRLHAAVRRIQHDIRERHVDRVEHHLVGGFEHVEGDRHLAVERELVGVRDERDRVVRRAHVARQLRGRIDHRRRGVHVGNRLRDRVERGAGQGEGDGGDQGATHGKSFAQ
jgi:hypothetical protein